MTVPATFRAFRIHDDVDGYRSGIEAVSLDELNAGEVVVKTAYSSVNYKDALAGTGKGKILRRFPLVGGIDIAGHVVASTSPAFREGDAVLVTGSATCHPWLHRPLHRQRAVGGPRRRLFGVRPAGRALGHPAARWPHPARGDDTGHRRLHRSAGPAADDREPAGARPGAAGRHRRHRRRGFAGNRDLPQGGGLDNVGGPMLAALLAQTAPYGNVASCGLAASHELHATVMPFIIRGVSLLGVASAGTARYIRDEVWRRLASDWKPGNLDAICTREASLDDLPAVFASMLAGGSLGRTVVQL